MTTTSAAPVDAAPADASTSDAPASGALPDPGTVLAALHAVPGVRSADLDSQGMLTLDLAEDVDEAEVATAVGRLLRDRFGIGVDPAAVSMVEAIEAVPADGPVAAAVEVRGMNVTSTGRKVHVTVTLYRGGTECAGEAAGTTSASGVHRAVAEATLHAIEELTEDVVIGRVERLEVDVEAVADLVLDVDGAEVAVSGRSPVQADVRQAIVRAILAAAGPHLP